MGGSSSEVLPTSQDALRWNPSRLSDACAPKKDPNSECLARDKPEMNPMTIKPESASHVTEWFSPFPSPSCPPPRQPFPMKPLAWTALLSSDNSLPSVRQELTLKPWKGTPFLHQKQYPGEKSFQTLSCREGNQTRQWQPAPVPLPGESQGQRSLVGCCLWGRTESDTTEVTAAAAATETLVFHLFFIGKKILFSLLERRR